MRTLPGETTAAFSAQGASICRCWRITRSDGHVLGMTDHDRDLTFLGTAFRSVYGGMMSAISQGIALAADESDILGVLSIDALGAPEIAQGAYDGALIEIWQVDWRAPERRIQEGRGQFGRVELEGDQYTVEFRSLKHQLDRVSGRVFGRMCDASLGDVRCGVSIADTKYRADAVVVSNSNQAIVLSIDGTYADGWFSGGVLILEEGVRTRPIANDSPDAVGRRLSFWEPFSPQPFTGEEVTLIAGCDKSLATCHAKFGNVRNFRGFPYIPGPDRALRVVRNGEGSR